MEQIRPHTALILFSRRLDSEARAKAWLGRDAARRNRALASLLISNAQRSAAASGLPVFQIDETRQRGDSFGERLADAYQQVFALGYRAVIAIGNDSPEIAQTDWAAICAALQSGKTVVGSTTRGGAYLIGLQADQFNAAAFAGIAWQCAETCASLKAQLLQAGCELHDQLPCLSELNTRADIARLLQGQRHPSGLLRLIADLFCPKTSDAPAPAQRAGTHARRGHALRGPPQALRPA